MNQLQHWIVTVDNRRAALFACSRLPGGGLHVALTSSIENAHESEHERHRPSHLGGGERRGGATAGSGHMAPSSASLGHEAEESQRRFAGEFHTWFKSATQELGIPPDRIAVFAASGVFGQLRTLLGKTEVRQAELTHLHPNQLAVHPAVIAAVVGPAGAAKR